MNFIWIATDMQKQGKLLKPLQIREPLPLIHPLRTTIQTERQTDVYHMQNLWPLSSKKLLRLGLRFVDISLSLSVFPFLFCFFASNYEVSSLRKH